MYYSGAKSHYQEPGVILFFILFEILLVKCKERKF